MSQQAKLRDAADGLDQLLGRLRQIADHIGLRDYTFEVHVGQLQEGVRAECRCVEGRSFAIITVDERFFTLSPQDQHEALVHEALHPLFHRLMQHVYDLRDELGRAHFEKLERVFRRDLEHIVDTLTSTIATNITVK